MRKQAEEERQQRAYMRLKALEVKWAEADKVVDAKRDEAYAKAGQVVAGWAERRKLVMDKSEKQDASNADRVAKQYEEKVARVAAWRVKEEERIAKRAAELEALVRGGSKASEWFVGSSGAQVAFRGGLNVK